MKDKMAIKAIATDLEKVKIYFLDSLMIKSFSFWLKQNKEDGSYCSGSRCVKAFTMRTMHFHSLKCGLNRWF